MMYLFAMLAGGLVVLSMVMNARIAHGLGVFQGALTNFSVGLLTAALLVAACFFLDVPIGSNETLAPWYAYSGALFGIAIVASCNVVIPRISVVYSAVLIFLGQIVSGLVLDAIIAGAFDVDKAVGALLVASGLLVNARIDAYSDAHSDAQPDAPENASTLPARACPGANRIPIR